MVPPPTRPVDAADRQPEFDLDADRLSAIHDALLTWFEAHGRDLPWRHTRDPWAILVSEVMLQQIQVARAIPFYLAFLARFPTVHDLAAAPLAAAIQVWGDLGRYKRVVYLHRAARIVVERHGGEIPSDVADLTALPGIGPYTAGAVACFAFGQDVAFADTNIRRVLHRLFVGSVAPDSETGGKIIDRLAATTLPAGRGWDWNQGLMDFGATLCTARNPGCRRCPLRDHCRGYPSVLALTAAGDAANPPRRSAYRYEGSDRYYRGRVLARLRAAYDDGERDEGLSLDELGAHVRDDFANDDLPWLRRVVDSLARDGLAIAEESAAYDAGESSTAGMRVKLPS